MEAHVVPDVNFHFGTACLSVPSELKKCLLHRFYHDRTEDAGGSTAVDIKTNVEASQAAVDLFKDLITAEERVVSDSLMELDITLVAEITAIADYFMLDSIVKPGIRRLSTSVQFEDSELIQERALKECTDFMPDTLPQNACVAVLRDGRIAFTSECGLDVHLLDLATGTRATIHEIHAEHGCLKVVSDNTLVRVGLFVIRAWNTATLDCTVQRCFRDQICCSEVVSEDLLALGFRFGGIVLFQLSTRACTELEMKANPTALLRMDDNAILSVCGSWNSMYDILVFNAGSTQAAKKFHLDLFFQHCGELVLLRGGRVAFDAMNDIAICEVETECVKLLRGHGSAVCTLVVLPDGRLASGSVDTTIKLWNVNTMCCTTTFTGHTRPVYQLVVLSDARIISIARGEPVKVCRTAVSKGAKTLALLALGVGYGLLRCIVDEC